MDKKFSSDPRSIRARKAITQALIDLLKVKPYGKITITDISESAGFARHTFYNHYETKEELLNSIIDSILGEYFAEMGPWNAIMRSPEKYQQFMQRFFEVWRAHAEVVEIFKSVDIDCLLINRLKAHFTEYYLERGNQEITGMGMDMAHYLINFNAYSFAAILRQWFQDVMKYSPEIMGQFLDHFAGMVPANSAILKFKDVIR
jgi:AcrR family transcriptional regulator